ncbi:MAG TPA: DegT/DnrJ/EryC1/StrS family aminotransferase [Arachnia sp.]|nr:DegT/DnrJ/EryC1/StrS family aminotransferase [Arachnia sp.]
MTTQVPFNDLQRAANAQSAQLAEIFDVVRAGGWFVQGPHHARFERSLADYLGIEFVLGLGSGTDALELGLRCVATPKRNVVITVANAGGYTSCAAVSAGLLVRYCDVDPETHTMSPDSLAPLLDDGVAAVVVTHLYGRLGDVPAVHALCAPHGIPVIEDCAQSLGARNADGMGGTLADIATFSFYPTKNLGALGDGGAIATRHAHFRDRLRSLRQYGWRGAKYSVVDEGGRNSRLDELQAAILDFRLGLLDDGKRRRREIVATYRSAASPVLEVLPANDESHVAHLAVVLAPDAAALQRHLAEAGVQTHVHFPVPDHEQPAWARFASGPLPVTESFRGRILSLPCFPELSTQEIDQVCRALASYKEPAL